MGGGRFGKLGGGWLGFSNIFDAVVVVVLVSKISLAPLVEFEMDVLKS